MEGGVEHGYMRDVGKYPPCPAHRFESGSVVQRRQVRQRGEVLLDRIVDEFGLDEASTAVHDSMADRAGFGQRLLERLDRPGALVLGDERQLQARRAGVDD
jgi:hypothetical protein